MTRRGQFIFFLPAFLLFLVFVLLPSAQTLIDSFYAHEGLNRRFVGALYYRYAVTDPKFHQSLGHNLIYMLWTLLFEVAVGLALAVSLEKNTRFNNFLRVAFFSPAVLSKLQQMPADRLPELHRAILNARSLQELGLED